jgi:hypothetical protein
VDLEWGSFSLVSTKLRSYLEEKVVVPVWKSEITAIKDPPR